MEKGVHRWVWAFAVLLVGIYSTAAPAQTAQERQLQTRLQGIDAVVTPYPSAAAVAAVVGGLAAEPFGPVAARIGETSARDAWGLALDECRRLLQDAADTLVPRSVASPALVSAVRTPVSQAVAERLRRFPPVITERYRSSLDESGRRFLTEWRATFDPIWLRRTVRELPFSTTADEAADLLGDLAFEAADFDEAYAWWDLAQPTPRRRAKQILARIFAGQFAAAETHIATWRKDYPNLRDRLANRTGNVGDTLDYWLRLRRNHAADDLEIGWHTFGGATTRNRVFAKLPDLSSWRSGDFWRADLVAPSITTRSFRRQARSFPVMTDQRIFLATNEVGVIAYDSRDGDKQVAVPSLAEAEPNVPEWSLLSADARRVYAVLDTTLLVCLAVKRSRPNDPPLWKVAAQTPDKQPAHFTSDPLVVGSSVFIVVSRLVGVRAQHFLACYQTHSGNLKWIKQLPEGGAWGADELVPVRPLTWAGERVVRMSHEGDITAHDPWSGKILWTIRYPAGPLRQLPLPPVAVYEAGRVLAAPADSSTLFCITAATGEVAWELPAVRPSHLLGVTADTVVFATDSGLHGVDVETGGARRRWQQPSGGRLPMLGRGLLIDGMIFWPIHDTNLPWRLLDASNGVGRDDPSRFASLPQGHLQFGQRSWAVVAPGTIWGCATVGRD